MVKPGGTGRPRLAISARLAPLPPSRSRSPALPSALPSPKVNTHWPDLTSAGFADGLAGLFFSALRAAGAAFRTGADDFDFAAIFIAVFLDFATALAMAYRQSERGMGVARLHHFGGFRASRETRFPALQVQPFQHAESDQADADQIDRDDQVEQPRHDQDQDARDQGHDGLNVRSGDDHFQSLQRVGKPNRVLELTRSRGSGIG